MEFSSCFEFDISQVSSTNKWDIKLTTRRETPYLHALMSYTPYMFVFVCGWEDNYASAYKICLITCTGGVF